MAVDPYFIAGALSILLAGGTLAWRGRSAPPLPSLAPAVLAELQATGAAFTVGERAAPVSVATLSDYECEGCALAHARLWPRLREHVRRGEVRYTVYETPLPRHHAGREAAVAAGCVASLSRETFWAYHQALFTGQAAWQAASDRRAALIGLAARGGADSLAVRRCMEGEGEERARRVERGWAAVKAGGVDFVPLWMVEGTPVPPARLEDEILAALRRRGHLAARVEAR